MEANLLLAHSARIVAVEHTANNASGHSLRPLLPFWNCRVEYQTWQKPRSEKRLLQADEEDLSPNTRHQPQHNSK